jgi:hypothetical protein
METRYAQYWKEGKGWTFEVPARTYRVYQFLFWEWRRLERHVLENPAITRLNRINAIRRSKLNGN